jgi:hypothetical protein
VRGYALVYDRRWSTVSQDLLTRSLFSMRESENSEDETPVNDWDREPYEQKTEMIRSGANCRNIQTNSTTPRLVLPLGPLPCLARSGRKKIDVDVFLYPS